MRCSPRPLSPSPSLCPSPSSSTASPSGSLSSCGELALPLHGPLLAPLRPIARTGAAAGADGGDASCNGICGMIVGAACRERGRGGGVHSPPLHGRPSSKEFSLTLRTIFTPLFCMMPPMTSMTVTRTPTKLRHTDAVPASAPSMAALARPGSRCRHESINPRQKSATPKPIDTPLLLLAAHVNSATPTHERIRPLSRHEHVSLTSTETTRGIMLCCKRFNFHQLTPSSFPPAAATAVSAASIADNPPERGMVGDGEGLTRAARRACAAAMRSSNASRRTSASAARADIACSG